MATVVALDPAEVRWYAARRSDGPYPDGVTLPTGWPEGSTRTNEWQRASPSMDGPQTAAWRAPCADSAAAEEPSSAICPPQAAARAVRTSETRIRMGCAPCWPAAQPPRAA